MLTPGEVAQVVLDADAFTDHVIAVLLRRAQAGECLPWSRWEHTDGDRTLETTKLKIDRFSLAVGDAIVRVTSYDRARVTDPAYIKSLEVLPPFVVEVLRDGEYIGSRRETDSASAAGRLVTATVAGSDQRRAMWRREFVEEMPVLGEPVPPEAREDLVDDGAKLADHVIGVLLRRETAGEMLPWGRVEATASDRKIEELGVVCQRFQLGEAGVDIRIAARDFAKVTKPEIRKQLDGAATATFEVRREGEVIAMRAQSDGPVRQLVSRAVSSVPDRRREWRSEVIKELGG